MTEAQNPILDDQIQAVLDQEHLKLLSIGYLVSGGMSAFFSLFGLMYAFMGLMMRAVISSAAQSSQHPNQVPPPEIAWFFGLFGLAIFLFMITLAALKFRVAWCLKRRRSRTFCLVVAGLSCLGIPYGTMLGVFSFIVLGRGSIQTLFTTNEAT